MNNAKTTKKILTKIFKNHPMATKPKCKKNMLSVRSGIRAGSGDDFGFTSCSLK